MFLRPFSNKRFSIERMFISFVWQRYGKRHKKALGKARKSGAEGESLKLLKIGRDAEKRGEVLQGKVMHDAGTTT